MKMKKSTLIHLPLQYFAEPGTPTDVDKGANPEDGGTPPAQPTFDDMLKANKELQAEFDRRVTKAQETALTNAKAEWEKQAQAEKEETARVAKMNADEKAKHEREKQEKALAEREAAITKREMSADAIEKLAENGLSPKLAKCFNYSSREAFEASYDEVTAAFSEAVADQVNEKLKGGKPPAAATGSNKTDPFLSGLGI